MAAPRIGRRVTPEQWQAVKKVMTKALQAPAEDRARIIDEECAGDELLRNEVNSLFAEVRADDDASGSIDDSLRNAVVAEAKALSSTRALTDVETLRAALQQKLGDSYDIVSTLGVGGMGAVFLAREKTLDRYVAIKTLRAEVAITEGGRERFRREARIAASLSHPGILPLHTFGETGGMWYLVMGYVRGQSLQQRLQTERRLAADEARRIMRALAEALEHAHQHHVIHRDIKPANILLDAESGRPLLSDFGISKILNDADALTNTGVMLGTPHYMSPEQIANAADCDERSDVYSLGAVAYAMLTGRAPLADDQASESPSRRASSIIVPIDRLNPATPADLSAVVMRCLATQPENRWPNARALRDALDRVDHSADAVLPASVREISGFGAYSVGWFVLWMASVGQVQSSGPRAVIVLLALLVPLGLALHVMRLKAPSTRRMQLLQVAFWPPLWWGMWWPRSLRRPGDVWSLLPWPAKFIRVVMSAFTISLPVLAFGHEAFGLMQSSGDFETRWYVTLGSLLIFTSLALASTVVWTSKLKLPFADDLLFIFGSTAPSAFWKRREIMRSLRQAGSSVREPEAEIPADYLRAMEDVQRASAHEASTTFEKPISAARDLVNSITALEREIAELERNAPASELARVTDRLASLRANSSTPQSEQQRALTDVVTKELELLRGLQQRRSLAATERVALFDKLRALWIDVSQTKAAADE
ncbi:MAG: serine/threonine-protein kinase [Gemmatimonadaceae bacterium]